MARKPSRQIAARRVSTPDVVAQGIIEYLGNVPPPRIGRTHGSVAADSKAVIAAAARRAGLVSGSLALPPGPVGWLTLVPELTMVWRIQAQMVSDLAAVHDTHAKLGREQMLYCLFRHSAAHAVRDLVAQSGERLLFRRTTQEGLQRVARHIGRQVSRRTIGEGLTRWLPLAGAVGVGWYAHHDTRRVGDIAVALFSDPAEVVVESPVQRTE